MSTEPPHVCQEMEGDHVHALLVVHEKDLLLLTDCKGESGSPKPAMVSEAICKELGIWLGKNSVNLDGDF